MKSTTDMSKTHITSNIPADRIDFFIALAKMEGGQVLEKLRESDGEFTLIVEFPGTQPAAATAADTAAATTPVVTTATPEGPPVSAPWLAIARAEQGMRETPGALDNARIQAYHATTADGSAPDAVPWCSSFVNWCITQAGLKGTNSKLARSWLKWGVNAKTPEPGCIVIFERGPLPKGHVGFLLGTESGRLRVLGGNQSNSVSVASFPVDRLIGTRRPSPKALTAAGLGTESAATLRHREIDTLARTVWGEARGETLEGMKAVTSVVVNRAQHGPEMRFGEGIAGVCHQPRQFSCWNEDDPNRAKLLAVTAADDRFAQCLRIAELAVNGNLPDTTRGSLHYHTATVHPVWSVGHTPVATIGSHLFFNDIT